MRKARRKLRMQTVCNRPRYNVLCGLEPFSYLWEAIGMCTQDGHITRLRIRVVKRDVLFHSKM